MDNRRKHNQFAYLIKLFGGKCYWCRRTLVRDEMSRDHLVPRSEGGGFDVDNLLLACKFCNSTRHSAGADEWGRAMDEALAAGVDPPAPYAWKMVCWNRENDLFDSSVGSGILDRKDEQTEGRTDMNHMTGEGYTPRELGFAYLASGNVAIVELNGDVSRIVSISEFNWIRSGGQEP